MNFEVIKIVFSNIPWSLFEAEYSHREISLGHYKSNPIAVGSYGVHKIVEIRENGHWHTRGFFPFSERYLGRYSVAAVDDVFYLFGKSSISFGSLVLHQKARI